MSDRPIKHNEEVDAMNPFEVIQHSIYLEQDAYALRQRIDTMLAMKKFGQLSKDDFNSELETIHRLSLELKAEMDCVNTVFKWFEKNWPMHMICYEVIDDDTLEITFDALGLMVKDSPAGNAAVIKTKVRK